MSLRRKFTIPERQLEACWEPVGFMQTERGAASEVCRRPASWWSCSLRVQARDEVLRGKIQGARPGVVMVLSQSAQTGVWSWCSDTALSQVRGRGARPQCSDGVLSQVRGLSAWMGCSVRCVVSVLGCSARTRPVDVSAQTWSSATHGGCGAWVWCSDSVLRCLVTHCRRGARTRCSGSVLGHTLWTWCSVMVLGRSSWMWCLDVVLRNGAQPHLVDTVLGRGAQCSAQT